MTAPDTGDRPPGAAADIPSQSGVAAALTPVLTVAVSLLGLCLLWGLAANAWPSRAFPG
ncbi:MAG: ABC transporter permease, partial [Mesorhizobium sp.]